MVAEDITFSSETVLLAGTLYKPDTETKCPAIVVLHAADGGTRQHKFYNHLATQLPVRGSAVLLFDRRGSGHSGGDFGTASFDTLASDGSAAVDYLRSRDDIDEERVGLYGISQGGWIAPLVAGKRSDIAFLIIISGCGVSPAEQMDYGASYSLRQAGFPEQVIAQAVSLRNRVNEYYRGRIPREVVVAELDRAQNEPWFQMAYLPTSERVPEDVTKSKWWYELDYDPVPIWQQIEVPTLFLFAERDRWVPIAESMTEYGMATAHMRDVTMVQVEGTDHLMGQVNNPETFQVSDGYIEELMSWLAKRL